MMFKVKAAKWWSPMAHWRAWKARKYLREHREEIIKATLRLALYRNLYGSAYWHITPEGKIVVQTPKEYFDSAK